ncbi:MAG: DoxX family protein [Porticoccaceae bacterium]
MGNKLSWKAVLAYLLAAFFLVGGIGNIFVSEQIAADYARWGYPDGFHYLTGILELAAAILLVFSVPLRLWGAALGAVVMVAALATLLLHGEYAHAVAPLAVLSVSVAVGWFNKPGSQP